MPVCQNESSWTWRSTTSLEPEIADDWTPYWRLLPRLLEERGTNKTFWCVYIQHQCGWDGIVPVQGEEPHDPGPWEHCGNINREAVKLGKEEPAFQCDGCGEDVPEHIAEHKALRQRELRQADPRINRRAAVLATRNKKRIK